MRGNPEKNRQVTGDAE